jgi:hypothetical protein
MIDDATEAGMPCVCGHPALSHVNPDAADERCSGSLLTPSGLVRCPCVEFLRAPAAVDPHGDSHTGTPPTRV